MLRPGLLAAASLPGRIVLLEAGQSLRQRALDRAADAAFQIFIRGALERGVRRDVRVADAGTGRGSAGLQFTLSLEGPGIARCRWTPGRRRCPDAELGRHTSIAAALCKNL